ncbi:hypothetical protein NSND_63207 [Nitrospira sp. ND1]|nr:hypothetical protein NSND_63207 [Nitrospira sp. ND1]
MVSLVTDVIRFAGREAAFFGAVFFFMHSPSTLVSSHQARLSPYFSREICSYDTIFRPDLIRRQNVPLNPVSLLQAQTPSSR